LFVIDGEQECEHEDAIKTLKQNAAILRDGRPTRVNERLWV